MEQRAYEEAAKLFTRLVESAIDRQLQALGMHGGGIVAALQGELDKAFQKLQDALEIDPNCPSGQPNIAFVAELLAEASRFDPEVDDPLPEDILAERSSDDVSQAMSPSGRVAVLSSLFNWPSTSGGIVHTIELNHFLARAGYQVRHVFARYRAWGIGQLDGSLPYEPEVLEFDDATWTPRQFQYQFRQAVREFQPDWVIITDSWNTKPLLAEAVEGFPYVLRLQADECLCPLNNLRMLPDGRQCPANQLATPETCIACLEQHGQTSGPLHQLEREFASVGTPEYAESLKRAFRNAEATLVVNPITQALLEPYCRQVHVAPSGFDAARFPWRWGAEPPRLSDRTSVLMAGTVADPIKGFSVLHEACARLWSQRQDFELLITAEPPGPIDPFTRRIGWLSQDELPQHMRGADMVVLPAVAAEALGRPAVEAMGVGRPVVASRIGGLPYTVPESAGLLFKPGDAGDLAEKLARLIDDESLRAKLGTAGREHFEANYTWDVIIERHYRPLLQRQQADTCVSP